MRPSRVNTDYRLSETRNISADEVYSTICVQWAADHFGLGLRKIDPLLTKKCAKNDLYIFVPSDLDIWALDLKYASLVTLVHDDISTVL